MADKIDTKLMNYLEEIKAFVKTTVKGSEIVLTNEIQKVVKRVTSLEVRLERTQDVVIELRHEMKEVRGEMKEMGNSLRGEMKEMGNSLRGEMKEMESRLATKVEMKEMESRLATKVEIKGMETRLSDKIDKVGEKVEANDARLDHHIANHL